MRGSSTSFPREMCAAAGRAHTSWSALTARSCAIRVAARSGPGAEVGPAVWHQRSRVRPGPRRRGLTPSRLRCRVFSPGWE
eukprot:14401177-Alexandrium_andersonii.AAC.1